VTPGNVRIVQTTWLKVLSIRETAAQLFYDRLFQLDPSLRDLFPGDLGEQRQKLMQVIDAVVNGLSRLEHLIPLVQELGRRHTGYGVKAHHYGTVGSALLWTLEQGLGDEFTEEVRGAWVAAYSMLASTMREAAAALPVQQT
jgi:hemoglobin-like flavoprotein